MTWTNLPTNYQNIYWRGLRKYEEFRDNEGVVSFADVTEYLNSDHAQLSANELNKICDTINKMMNGEVFYSEAEVDSLLQAKQDLLTFDNTPTASSSNPVTSDGIKSALDAINSRIDSLSGFNVYICSSGEYDPTTLQPIIQNPEENTFYLVPSGGTNPDIFMEWIYVNSSWEVFGSAGVDLSNYVTSAELTQALLGKQDLLTFDNTPTASSSNPVTSDGIKSALDGKSDTSHTHDDRYYTESEVNTLLSAKVDNSSIKEMAGVDDAPSDNRMYGRKNGLWSEVVGGGGSVLWGSITGSLSDQNDLKSALNNKLDVSVLSLFGGLAFENDAPNNNKIYGRVNNAWTQVISCSRWGDIIGSLSSQTDLQTILDGKQATLTFDNTPTASSSNPVTSDGIKTAVDAKVSKTGDTMTGNLILDSANIQIKKSGENAGQIYNSSTNQMVLVNYASSSTHPERFYTPAPSVRTSAVNYYLLTTKEPVTTAQGGTGGTDSGWTGLTGGNFTGTIYYRQVGVFVSLYGYQLKLNSDLSSASITFLSGKLPIPNGNLSFPAGNNQGFGQLIVTTNGNLVFYKESGVTWVSTRNINFVGFYMTA